MLGLITWNDIWNVINFDKDKDTDRFVQGQFRRLLNTYKQRPGFFSPYENNNEWVGGLLATLIYPVAFSILAAASVICAVIGIVVGVGCLLIATAALFGGYEICDEAFENAITAFYFTGLVLVAAAVSSFVAVVNLFHAPISFLTRSGASIYSLFENNSQLTSETSTVMSP